MLVRALILVCVLLGGLVVCEMGPCTAFPSSESINITSATTAVLDGHLMMAVVTNYRANYWVRITILKDGQFVLYQSIYTDYTVNKILFSQDGRTLIAG